MKVQGFALSDVGRVRKENQDSSACFPDRRLFVVADGMGGYAGGQQASRLAVETLDELVPRPAEPLGHVAAERAEAETAELVAAVREANRRIIERAAGDSQLRGMGTTLVALRFHADGATLVHVGDSRAYRLRDGHVEQLTVDHSVVADLVHQQNLTAAEARLHPYRHVLTRALGAGADVNPAVARIDVRPGDVYLLCSDGICDAIPPHELDALMRFHADDSEALCQALVAAANAAGGRDNPTALAVRCAS